MFVTVDLAVLAAVIVAVMVVAAIMFVGPGLRARKGIADQERGRNRAGGWWEGSPDKRAK